MNCRFVHDTMSDVLFVVLFCRPPSRFDGDLQLMSMVDAVQTFKKDKDVTKNSAEHR